MPNIDEKAKAWQSDTAKRFGEAVAHLRKEQRLTAAQLADRTREVGFPIHRVAIAKIESNSRGGKLDIAEVATLARALRVPPAALLYPNLPDGQVEPWPGHTTRSIHAVQWFSGEITASEASDYVTEMSPEDQSLQTANSELVQRSRQLEKYRNQLPTWDVTMATVDLEDARKAGDPAEIAHAESKLEQAREVDSKLREYVVQLMAAMISRGMVVAPGEGHDEIFLEAMARARLRSGDA